MITGSPDTGRCGIHDFTLRLKQALSAQAIDANVLDHRDWSVTGTIRLAKRLREIKPDIVHMQYPMIVGWRSLGPHVTGFLSRFPQVVTLHEFSSFDRFRRASLRAFTMSAAKIVLTTEFEKARFLLQFPGVSKDVTVIPIGSNIPFAQTLERGRSDRTIVHFGQIKPLKGLEQFIELVEQAAAQGRSWRYQVIGAPVTWAGDYLQRMKARVAHHQVEWIFDCGDDEASRLLARADAAYLPYPDGVSERRGSLIAALGNGLPVLTTHGEYEPADIKDVVLFASDPRQAEQRLSTLFSQPSLEEQLRKAGPAYVEHFAWDRIARAYGDVYREVLVHQRAAA